MSETESQVEGVVVQRSWGGNVPTAFQAQQWLDRESWGMGQTCSREARSEGHWPQGSTLGFIQSRLGAKL